MNARQRTLLLATVLPACAASGLGSGLAPFPQGGGDAVSDPPFAGAAVPRGGVEGGAGAAPDALSIAVAGRAFILGDAIAVTGTDTVGDYLDLRLVQQSGYCAALQANPSAPGSYIEVLLRPAATGFTGGTYPVTAAGAAMSAQVDFGGGTQSPDLATEGSIMLLSPPAYQVTLTFTASAPDGSRIVGPVTATLCQALARSLDAGTGD